MALGPIPPSGHTYSSHGHPLNTCHPLLTLRLCPNWEPPEGSTGWGGGAGVGAKPGQGGPLSPPGYMTAPQQGPHHSQQEGQLEIFWGALHKGHGSEGETGGDPSKTSGLELRPRKRVTARPEGG